MLKYLPSFKNSRALYELKETFDAFKHEPVIDIDKRTEQKFDMAIYRLEEVVSVMAGIIPPIRQNSYIIVLVTAGSGEKRIGKLSFPIKENTLYIIPTREIHSGNFTLNKCSGYALFFEIDFFLKTDLPKQCISNRRIFKENQLPYRYLDNTQSAAVAEVFESMMLLDDGDNNELNELIAVKILELLMVCDHIFLKNRDNEKAADQYSKIDRFFYLLDGSYRENRSVSQYASMLNIHPNHLNFLLKKRTGKSAKHIINNKIISESKYLLSNSVLIIKEVSNSMGFEDPNNFSSFFQKCTGISPILYRLTCPVFNGVNHSTERRARKEFINAETIRPRQMTA